MSNSKHLGTAYMASKRKKKTGQPGKRSQDEASEHAAEMEHAKESHEDRKMAKGGEIHPDHVEEVIRSIKGSYPGDKYSENDHKTFRESAKGAKKKHLVSMIENHYDIDTADAKDMAHTNNKYAKGGNVSQTIEEEAEDKKGQHKRPYQQKGVHMQFAGKGKSMMGHVVRGNFSEESDAKPDARKVLEEGRNMPAPKLKGLASGGRVTPKSRPAMQESPVFKIKPRDEESDKDINELVPMKDAEDMGNNGDDMPMEDDREEMYAKGGRVHTKPGGHPADEDSHGPTGPTNYRNRNKSSDMDGGQRRGPQGYPKYQEQAQNEKGIHTPVSGVTGFPGGHSRSKAGKMSTETYGGKPHRELRDHGKDLHKKKLKEMQDMPAPKLKGLAEGGEVEADQHDSISAAIMARREKMHAEIDSGAHDLDEAVKMAEGGSVDLEDNMESPSDLDDRQEAALKENYDSDIEDMSQPEDSNEKGHKIQSDMHDMVEKIRKIVAAKRK